MKVLGIDIGGSGIKGAPVDTIKGILILDRSRVPTPVPSKPEAVADTVKILVDHFSWKGPIGCGFPSPIVSGVTMTAANVHKKWIGTDASKLLSEATGCPVKMINDADAAGLAEMRFGAGKGRKGVVMIVTIGTGLGSAMFVEGTLVPNLELGHLEIRGKDAELRASDAARNKKNLSWKEWTKRFNEYLSTLEKLFWPDLFILGGGGSKKFDKFKDYLKVRAEVVPAATLNEAGIIGAALAAKDPA